MDSVYPYLHTHTAVDAGAQRPVFRVWEALSYERELIQNWWLLTMSAKQDNVPFSTHSRYMRLKLWSSRQGEKLQGKPTDGWETDWGELELFVEAFIQPAERIKIPPYFQASLSAKMKNQITGRYLEWHNSKSKNLSKVVFNELEWSFYLSVTTALSSS